MTPNPKDNIPTKTTTAEAWLEWHKELKDYFGLKSANALWLKAWGKVGNGNDNETLRTYLKTQGITISTGILATAEDSASGVLDSIGSALSIGKYAGLAIGGVVLVLGVILVFNIVKDPNRAIASAGALK